MTRSASEQAFTAAWPPGADGPSAEYVPGVCNIGPAEVARRRRGAIVGTVATAALYLVLVAAGVDRPWRLVVGIPAAGAAVSWLQVLLRFCVAFASLGVYNFRSLGDQRVAVVDAAARRADRRRLAQMLLTAVAAGVVVAVIAATVP